MNRRKYLALAASSLAGGLAGCTGMSSTVGDFVEDRSGASEPEDLDVELSTSGPALLITPTDSLPYEAELYQSDEKVATVGLSGSQSVYYEIIDCDRAGDPDKRLFEPGPIELVFVDSDGNEMGTKEWDFRPSPVVEDFTIATVSGYDPAPRLSETTPVFTIRNIGTGPTCITAIEIANPRKSVSLGDSESSVSSPMLRTGTYSVDHSRISLCNTPTPEGRLLPAEQNSYIAFDGLFTATMSDMDLSASNAPSTLRQKFDLNIHTAYGETHTTTVSVAMVGGVVTADTSESEWTHRYRTVRFDDVSYDDPR